MSPQIELVWPTESDDALWDEAHRVIHAVVALGGAVGYLDPPGRDQTDPFLDAVVADVRDGNAALVLARVDGVIAATGLWRRVPIPIFEHSAELGKIMAHPSARGLGLGRLVVGALTAHARSAGIETLTLGVRGNNHGAIEMYEELGFLVWGTLPNVIEVGHERFDEVRMYLGLGKPPGVVSRGSAPGGAGSSPRRGHGGSPPRPGDGSSPWFGDGGSSPWPGDGGTSPRRGRGG